MFLVYRLRNLQASASPHSLVLSSLSVLSLSLSPPGPAMSCEVSHPLSCVYSTLSRVQACLSLTCQSPIPSALSSAFLRGLPGLPKGTCPMLALSLVALEVMVVYSVLLFF